MKIVRWKGLLAFFVISTALAAVVLIFSEGAVKSLIETNLTNMNKAQVDVGSVEITYSPFSITVNDVQVTDNENANNNAVQIGQAKFSLVLKDLLLEKINIDEMTLKSVRTDTKRSIPGHILSKGDTKEEVSSQDKGASLRLPSMSLPDVDKVLEEEKLDTVIKINNLTSDLTKTEVEWKKLSQDINNKQRWDSHEEKYLSIKALYKGGFSKKIKALKEAKKLSNEYKQELSRIRTARSKINADLKRLDKGYEDVQSAPKADMARIKKKYNVSELSSGNISQLIFGKKVAEYIEVAKLWKKRLKPYMPADAEDEPVIERQRLKGEDVLFEEYNPRPAFYVHKVSVGIETNRGLYNGIVKHISSDQMVSKKPVTFEFNKQKAKNGNAEVLTGVVDFTEKNQRYVKAKYIIKSQDINNVVVSSSESLTLNLENAVMDLLLSMEFKNDNLSGDSSAKFTKVGFDASSSSSGSLSKVFVSSFSKVDKFSVDTRVSGSLKKLKVKIKSDLDDQIGSKMKSYAKESKEKFNRQLKKSISSKISGPMDKLENKREGINKMKQEIDQKEKLVKQKLSEIKRKFKR